MKTYKTPSKIDLRNQYYRPSYLDKSANIWRHKYGHTDRRGSLFQYPVPNGRQMASWAKWCYQKAIGRGFTRLSSHFALPYDVGPRVRGATRHAVHGFIQFKMKFVALVGLLLFFWRSMVCDDGNKKVVEPIILIFRDKA